MYYIFKLLAMFRGARALHPRGYLYSGTIIFEDKLVADIYELDKKYPAKVRLSRGVGLPGFIPDIQGMAIRIENGDSIQDWLLAIGGQGRLTKYTLHLSRYINTYYYTSCFPYRLNGKTVLLGAKFIQKAPVHSTKKGLRSFEDFSCDLLVAKTFGLWHKVGTLHLDRVLSAEESQAISYNPWNTVPQLRPTTWLNQVRHDSYKGSRDGRNESGR